MFGQQSAERFEKDRLMEEPTPGPGAYEVLSSDGKGVVMDTAERWSEGGDLKEATATEHFSPISPPCRTPTPARGRPEKENRIPLSARTKGQRCASPPSWTTAPTPKKGGQVPSGPGPTPEFGDDGRQRQKDLRLASKLDMVRDELRQKTKEAKELQLALTTKDRKIEDLSKKVEELAADRREAHRRTLEAESEVGAKRRQLHEKEQDVAALQRKLELARVARKEWTKHADKREEEQRNATNEMQRMRQSVESLQEHLANSEKNQQVAEHNLRQEQRRCSDLEAGLQAHIEVLEEQIVRETSRRKELEERQAKDGAEREEGEVALKTSRDRCEQLQGRVAELEMDMKKKIAEAMVHNQQHMKLEDKVQSLQLSVEASAKLLQDSESSREELARQVEVSAQQLQASKEELHALKTQCASLKDELLRFGEERHLQLQNQVQLAEKQVKDLTRALTEEKARNEVMEQRVSEFKEKETSLVANLENERQQRMQDLTDDLMEERARNEVMERKINDLEEKERSTFMTLETERQERLRDTEICELEARALRAEAEAEEARQMVERWKEWGDEQQLRELAAETERLERLKQVREEVSQQVEAARQELVAENRTLQKRITELEKPLQEKQPSPTQDTPKESKEPKVGWVSRSLFEEQRQRLQNQCSETEGRVKAAETKLRAAQEKVESVTSEKRSWEEERKSFTEKIAMLEEAVREAASHIADGNGRVVCLRWQQTVESAFQQRREEALKEAWAIRARPTVAG